MKFFITGDTHHNLEKVYSLFKQIKGIDMILHTGDYEEDAEILQETLNIPVVCVPGNCDGSYSSSDFKIVSCECGNILVTHGHMFNVDYNYDKLLYLAEENDCIAVISGHTHVPFYEEFNGIHLINPGSLSRPRDGSNGSYAVVTTTSQTFACSIMYYAKSLDKAKGGYIKDMLNYSDRF